MPENANTTLWYSVAACALVTFFALRWLTYCISRFLTTWSIYVILKYLQYTEIQLLRRLSIHVTIGDVILYIILLSANVICIGWRVQSLTDLNTRTASMLTTNLALLLPSIDIVSGTLRISLRTYKKIHTAIASLVVVQGILHPCLAAYPNGLLWDLRSITGMTVSGHSPNSDVC